MADKGGDLRAEKAEVVAVDLPAPQGWEKKFMLKKGGTPRRNEIIFIAPTGEEIKNKKQLDQYLKSHPGGPESSEFDWGTGDTPRRSARLSVKAKAVETPEGEKPNKRERKSSSKKGAKDKKDDEEADDSAEAKEDNTKEEAKDAADVEMKEADDAGEKTEGADVAVVVTVNKDANIEVAVDKGAAVEIAMEAVNESAIEQSEENTEGDVEEKLVESAVKKDETENAIHADISAADVTKGQTEADVKPAESEALPYTDHKEVSSAENGEKVEVPPENCSHKDNEGVNESAIEQHSEEKTEGDVEEKLVESAVKKDETENATHADISASDVTKGQTEADVKPAESEALPATDYKEVSSAENGEKAEVLPENCSHKDNEGVNESAIEQDSEEKTEGDVEEKLVESAVTDETENATHADISASDVTVGQTGTDVKPAESEELPPTDPTKEVSSAENGEKAEAPPENCSHKDNEGTTITKEAPSVSYDDGQHQPKASPILLKPWYG